MALPQGQLTGIVAKDIEFKATLSGKERAYISISCYNNNSNEKRYSIFRCVVFFERHLNYIKKAYLKKGDRLGISYSLDSYTYPDSTTGQKKYHLEIRVLQIEKQGTIEMSGSYFDEMQETSNSDEGISDFDSVCNSVNAENSEY